MINAFKMTDLAEAMGMTSEELKCFSQSTELLNIINYNSKEGSMIAIKKMIEKRREPSFKEGLKKLYRRIELS